MQFKDVITDPAQFREVMGEPPPPCVAKTIAIVDRHCRAFIARSPCVLIASASARGQMDISPKGDAPGFVRVLDDSLRVSGSAKIVRDADLRESMAARGKTPDFALAVEVEEAFFHCSKCIVRSSLWIPQAWPALDGLPSLAQTMVDAAALPMPVEALEEIIKQDESERLY